MNYKELLFNKDKVLTFCPELSVILNEYDKYLVKIGYEINGKKWKSKQCGLNAAIVLNQINYWNELNEKLKSKKHFKDGYYWTYHAYDKWAKEDFPFWSGDTVRRAVKFLEDIRLVISTDEYNSWKADNTKWYRIDFEKLQEIINIVEELRKERREDEIEEQVADTVNADCGYVMASCIDSLGSEPKAVPEITPKNTNRDYNTENTSNSFSNEKDNSNPDGLDLYKSHSRENETRTTLTLGKKTREKKIVPLKDMPTRVYEIAFDLFGEEIIADKTKDCVSYFLGEYKAFKGKEHIPLTNETLAKIVETMVSTITIKHEKNGESFETDYKPLISDEVAESDYRAVIDEYFLGKIKNSGYSLVYFAQDGVLTNLMHKCERTDGMMWYESYSF